MVSDVKSCFWSILVLIVITIINISGADDDYPVVDTKYGKIRGLRKKTIINNIDYDSFKGIHYGKNPVGELRFKAPEPREPWAPKVLDAFEHTYTCVRPILIPMDATFEQDEDCLAINIYVPATASPTNKLPVLFYIHGGGYNYMSGNAGYYSGDYLLEHDIIVVTLNYRLGIFGFLSLDTPEYSGNMGMKDQQLALKWVYENIGEFNGDNKRITVGGYSAGAASAHFHVLSSESRQYINNAILNSGNVGCVWSMTFQNHLDVAYETADDFGHENCTFDELIDFLKTIPAEKISYLASVHTAWLPTLNFDFAPVIERKDAIRPFLTVHPFEQYKSSNIDVDILFTNTHDEIVTFFSIMAVIDEEGIWEINDNFTLGLPFKELQIPFESEVYRTLAPQVRRFYFGDAKIDDQSKKLYLNMLNHINFDYGTYKSVKIHQKESKGNVYMFRFSANTTMSSVKETIKYDYATSGHIDDLCYMFACPNWPNFQEFLAHSDSEKYKLYLQTVKYLTKMMTNFIKYGEPAYRDNPIAGFRPIGDDFLFVDVTNDGLKLDMNPYKVSMEMWTRLEQQAREMMNDHKKQ